MPSTHAALQNNVDGTTLVLNDCEISGNTFSNALAFLFGMNTLNR